MHVFLPKHTCIFGKFRIQRLIMIFVLVNLFVQGLTEVKKKMKENIVLRRKNKFMDDITQSERPDDSVKLQREVIL